MVTWEFPPRIVGGLSRHCHGLSRALFKKGCEVDVVTLEFPGASSYEEVDGVRVHRVAVETGHPNFISWVLLFNHFMEKHIAKLARSTRFDLIHIHDWLTVFAGVTAKHFMGKPLVITIHSTEFGRCGGLYTQDSLTINSVEWWGIFEASRVITISSSMKGELCEHFKVPPGKVDVVANGVDYEKFNVYVDKGFVRSRYEVSLNEKLILFIGRLTPQKGVEHLVKAVPMVMAKHPNTKFIIVGDGWMRGEMQRQAQATGYGSRILFTGFLPNQELIALLLSSDALVIPSIYEPFGIVALEAMAAGTPVIVSQVGGLAEVVEHEKTGIWVYPGDASSIAWGIDRILSDEAYAKQLAEKAKETVRKAYNWEAIANKTIEIYRKAVGG